MLSIRNGSICDSQGRVLYLRGVNVDGMSKMPSNPCMTTFHCGEHFFDGDTVSFVGRPFELSHAPKHFSQIKSWGFNTIRYIFTWEAIEHQGPGIYDQEFVDYTIKVLQIAKDHGFHVFLDPHQDTWGRFSGGSGAPLWTYYAAGFEPRHFKQTRAAIVQNTWEDPESMPKMVWPTNYYRLTCQTMFTLFLAGKHFAPKCIINGENIQDFLQNHMLNACLFLYKQVAAAGLFEDCVFGVENMNEPNLGLLGLDDITKLSDNQNLRLASTPTALESMRLGMGMQQHVDNHLFGTFGPKYVGKKSIDPEGVKAWVTSDEMDKHYGFQRDSGWELGKCVWALHGVWDIDTGKALKKNYFHRFNNIVLHEHESVDIFFRAYFVKYLKGVRNPANKLPENLLVLCQPPTLAPPPRFRGDPILKNVIYAPHFYDGLTLMLKRWSAVWAVDSLGFLRGNYRFPVAAIKLGDSAIYNNLRSQLRIIYQDAIDHLGSDVPILMSETGMPMDMNDRESYHTGNYTAQIRSLDALISGVESHNMHYTLWGYSCENDHERGDQWNREDFSLISATGPRAEEAYVRPCPLIIDGTLVSTHFDLRCLKYNLCIQTDTEGDHCTQVFVPSLHFKPGIMQVTVSEGTFDMEDENLFWHHGKGKHTLSISSGEQGVCTIS